MFAFVERDACFLDVARRMNAVVKDDFFAVDHQARAVIAGEIKAI